MVTLRRLQTSKTSACAYKILCFCSNPQKFQHQYLQKIVTLKGICMHIVRFPPELHTIVISNEVYVCLCVVILWQCVYRVHAHSPQLATNVRVVHENVLLVHRH